MKTDIPPVADLSIPKITARFPDEASAIEYFESIRWSAGIVCPHCNNNDQNKFWKIEANKDKKIRVGLRQCVECKKQFRVTVGTIFEDSHVPLNLWLIAWYLMSGAKKGISALQLKRSLWGDKKGSYKTAWFMCHRIRHAMADPVFEGKLTGTVEVDETYVGPKMRGQGCYKAWHSKTPIVSLVERGAKGRKRSIVVERVTAKTVKAAIREHVAQESMVNTDESQVYRDLNVERPHETINHGKRQYSRKGKDGNTVTTNTVESSFALLAVLTQMIRR